MFDFEKNIISNMSSMLFSAIEKYLHEKENNAMNNTKESLKLLLDNVIINNSNKFLSTIYQSIFNFHDQYICILDNDSNFISINEKHANVIGYKKPENLLGLSYDHFKCRAVEKAETFREQDANVLKTREPLVFLSYHCYHNDNWRLLYGTKTGIFDENKIPTGIFSSSQDITDSGLIDISRFLLQDSKNYFGEIAKNSFSYYITQDTNLFNISLKEQEVLFYSIRGKSADEIAHILNRSKRTVEMHLNSLKIKFQVSTKSQLIEKSIIEGYFTQIPKSLLTKNKLHC